MATRRRFCNQAGGGADPPDRDEGCALGPDGRVRFPLRAAGVEPVGGEPVPGGFPGDAGKTEPGEGPGVPDGGQLLGWDFPAGSDVHDRRLHPEE